MSSESAEGRCQLLFPADSPPTFKALGKMFPAASPTVKPRLTVKLGSFLSTDHSKTLQLRLQGGQPWGPTSWQPLFLSEPLPVFRFNCFSSLGSTDPPRSLTRGSFFECNLILCLGLDTCPKIPSIVLEADALCDSTLFWFSSLFTIYNSNAETAQPLIWGYDLKKNNEHNPVRQEWAWYLPRNLSLCSGLDNLQGNDSLRCIERPPKFGGWLNILNE